MKIKKLQQIEEMEQLGACRFPLLLGVMSSNNGIKNFIHYTAKVLQVQYALLYFKDDPYIWYYESQQLYAIEKENLINFEQDFTQHLQLDEAHENYAKVLHYLQQYGDYQRLIGFNLQQHDHHQTLIGIDKYTSTQPSFGQVIFFDELEQPFTALQKELVLEYCLGMVNYLELKYNYNQLHERFEEQQALNFSKTKFMSIIAHDLRAPFHGLLGFSEVLATELNDLNQTQIQNIADYLYDTSKSTYALLENLLHWSMAENGRFAYHPIQFKVKQVSTIVYDILKNVAIQKNIQLIDTIDEHISVYADINMITSLLQNLVSNALKFTPMNGQGKITLSAYQQQQHIVIQVSDNGVGMSQAQLEHLFQPRVTFSFKGTAGEQGTGFGLALCQRFAHLNHGEIKVTSQEGKGTQFNVYLPSHDMT